MVYTLRHRTSLLVIRAEIIYTLYRLLAHPLAAKEAPPLEEVRSQWQEVQEKELALNDERAQSQANADSLASLLEDLMDRTAKVVLMLTKNDRGHPLFTLLFGSKKRRKKRTRSLERRLNYVRGWVPTLKESEHESLNAISVELEAFIPVADAAVEQKAAVERKIRDFRGLGARWRLLNKTNAARKAAYGSLSKLPHEQMGLRPDFAAGFFRRETRDANDDEATVTSVKATIEGLKVELMEQEELLGKLNTEAEQEATELAAELLEQKELAEIQKNKATLKEQEAVIRARIAAKKSKKR